MDLNRTIIVSISLPVNSEDDPAALRINGCLADSFAHLYKKNNVLWIGCRPPLAENQLATCDPSDASLSQKLIPVELSSEEAVTFHTGFCQETLWPLFHYFPSAVQYNQDYWDAYVSINERVANTVLATAQPSDTLWIHDYHLLLVPEMIRSRMPEARIGFFQHVPFPSYELFRLLPWSHQLLKSLLGADLIGFHTQDDVSNFLDTIKHFAKSGKLNLSVFGNEIIAEGRNIMVHDFPMGIDYEKHKKEALHQADNNPVRNNIGDKKVLLSVDRLDYSKGILERLKAYDKFLKDHGEFKEKLVFLQIVTPPTEMVLPNQILKEEINKLVSDINTRHSTFDWTPICYFYRTLSSKELSSLYVAADVALITPLRDAMNLVSKEYVASKEQVPGVLVLSEMAGAARELAQAFLINPNNLEEFSEAIYKSLTLSLPEQQRRMKAMQQTISAHPLHQWANSFIETLTGKNHAQRPLHKITFSPDRQQLEQLAV